MMVSKGNSWPPSICVLVSAKRESSQNSDNFSSTANNQQGGNCRPISNSKANDRCPKENYEHSRDWRDYARINFEEGRNGGANQPKQSQAHEDFGQSLTYGFNFA